MGSPVGRGHDPSNRDRRGYLGQWKQRIDQGAEGR